jgi:peptide alpha-N-acetyltransferase
MTTNTPTERYVLALKCLNEALALDEKHPALHAQAIQLRHALNSEMKDLDPKVQEALKNAFTAIPASADLKQLNAEFLEKHSNSAQHRVAAARAAVVLGEERSKAEKDLVDALRIKDNTFEDAAALLEQLKSWKSGELATFKKAAHEKWPEVSVFA